MAEPRVELTDSALVVHDLLVERRDVVDWLRSLPESERAAALVRAIEVGTFCLQRASGAIDTEAMKRQVEGLIFQIRELSARIPGATEQALVAKLGTEPGQVLAPVKAAVEAVEKATQRRLAEVETLLREQIDPANRSGALGRALDGVKEALDPARKDSVQGAIAEAVRGVTAADGALAVAVQKAVAAATAPLVAQVSDLAKQVRADEAAEEAIAGTTLKGRPFEEEVLEAVQEWARSVGAEVQHIGPENRAGDILVRVGEDSVAGAPLVVVVETKDETGGTRGRKKIAEEFERAMVERGAEAGLWVCRTREGFTKEVGEWLEGSTSRGPFVATVREHLLTALRFLLVQSRLARLRAARPELDAAAIEAQVTRVQTSLRRIQTIQALLGKIHKASDEVGGEAETLRNEIREALGVVEDAIRQAAGSAPSAGAA